jgi:MFS-type transporter involved in bile tolerance (Atg22 family)
MNFKFIINTTVGVITVVILIMVGELLDRSEYLAVIGTLLLWIGSMLFLYLFFLTDTNGSNKNQKTPKV